jgi:di/tricarboxylate transporter
MMSLIAFLVLSFFFNLLFLSFCLALFLLLTKTINKSQAYKSIDVKFIMNSALSISIGFGFDKVGFNKVFSELLVETV